jgi:hypothetical protein
MPPNKTDVGQALRAMAQWRLAGVLVIVYVVLVCLGLFVALALTVYLHGSAPLPTRPPLLP